MHLASLLVDLHRAESQVVAARNGLPIKLRQLLGSLGSVTTRSRLKRFSGMFEIALAKHLSEQGRLRTQLALLEGTEARANPRHAQTRPLPAERSGLGRSA